MLSFVRLFWCCSGLIDAALTIILLLSFCRFSICSVIQSSAAASATGEQRPPKNQNFTSTRVSVHQRRLYNLYDASLLKGIHGSCVGKGTERRLCRRGACSFPTHKRRAFAARCCSGRKRGRKVHILIPHQHVLGVATPKTAREQRTVATKGHAENIASVPLESLEVCTIVTRPHSDRRVS
jgi:hypothetical protein